MALVFISRHIHINFRTRKHMNTHTSYHPQMYTNTHTQTYTQTHSYTSSHNLQRMSHPYTEINNKLIKSKNHFKSYILTFSLLALKDLQPLSVSRRREFTSYKRLVLDESEDHIRLPRTNLHRELVSGKLAFCDAWGRGRVLYVCSI